MHKCKYIKWLQGVSPTENVNYIENGLSESRDSKKTHNFSLIMRKSCA